MKKITLLFMLFVGFVSYGQLWTINSCSAELGSSSYGPMSSVATANAVSRTAIIYPAAQLAGISGQELTSMYFKRTTGTGAMAGTANFKIYLKETTATDWGAGGLDWATATTGATLVYDSNPASSVGSSAGWKNFTFSTNFTYSGAQNLAVFFEYKNETASSAISYSYEYTAPCISTSNSNTTKYSNATTGVLPTSLASNDYRRAIIGFDFSVSCNAPTDLVVSGVTSTGATINWTASTSAPTLGYDYYVSTTATAPTGTTTPTGNVASGTTLTLTDLPSATNHYVWVRSNCVAGDASLWKAASFFTLCPPITTVPWTENFDSMTTLGANIFPSNCWRSIAGGSSSSTHYTSADAATNSYNNPMSAPNYVTIYYPTTNAAYLYAPAMQLTAGQSYDFSFYFVGDGTLGWDGQVVYNTAQQVAGATVLGASFVTSTTTTNGSTYTKVTRTFVPATTGVYHFGIRTIALTTAPFYLGFDDFKVALSPTCIEPTALTASAISATGATVSWTPPSNAPSLGYDYYRATTATAPTASTTPTGTVTTGTSVTFTDLTANTTYYVWVRSNCGGGDLSAWSLSLSFTSSCVASAVPSTQEGFEVATTLPACWSSALITGTTNWGVFTPTGTGDIATAHAGTKIMVKPYTSSDAILVSNPFDYSSVTSTTRVNVWLFRHASAANADRYRFFVNTAATLTGATQVFELFLKTTIAPTETATGWYNYTFDIPAAMHGQPYVYVIAQGTTANGFSSYTLGIDDFKIEFPLSTASFSKADIKVYPNPVKNILNLSYSQDISDVAVFNLLGQQVLAKKVNATESQIDMSSLTQGTYLVKVTVENQVKTIKVIKE